MSQSPNNTLDAQLSQQFIKVSRTNPSITATGAAKGTILIFVGATPKVFQKADDGINTNWNDITGGSAGANQQLSNLGTTAINADLIFSKAGPVIQTKDGGTGDSEFFIIQTGNAPTAGKVSGSIDLFTGDSDSDTGYVAIGTGTSANGNSGNLTLYCGDAPNGNVGVIILGGRALRLPNFAADPVVTGIPDFSVYFNTVSESLRILISGAWQDLTSGSSGGGGAVKVQLHDGVSTTLSTGAPVIIDNVTVANDDLVLFTNLIAGNNKIYKATVAAGSVTAWAVQTSFSGSSTPVNGDQVYVQEGDLYQKNLLLFDGSDFENLLNQKVPLTLNDNVSNTAILEIDTSFFKNFIMEYSVDRPGIGHRNGIFGMSSDGTDIGFSDMALGVVNDDGVTFDAVMVGSIMRLRYSTTNGGVNAQLERTARVW